MKSSLPLQLSIETSSPLPGLPASHTLIGAVIKRNEFPGELSSSRSGSEVCSCPLPFVSLPLLSFLFLQSPLFLFIFYVFFFEVINVNVPLLLILLLINVKCPLTRRGEVEHTGTSRKACRRCSAGQGSALCGVGVRLGMGTWFMARSIPRKAAT